LKNTFGMMTKTLEKLHWLGLVGSVGGILWLIKGIAILINGIQPPAIFGLGALFFIIGLLGLSVRTADGALKSIGVIVTFVGLISATLILIINEIFPELIPTGNVYSFPGTILFLLASLSMFVGLIAFGAAMMQVSEPPWRALPLGMGLSFPAIIFIGGVLEAINPPLFEIPLMLFGLAWVVLGVQIWR